MPVTPNGEACRRAATVIHERRKRRAVPLSSASVGSKLRAVEREEAEPPSVWGAQDPEVPLVKGHIHRAVTLCEDDERRISQADA